MSHPIVVPALAYKGDLLRPLELLAEALRRKGENVPENWPQATLERMREGKLRADIFPAEGKVGGILITTPRPGRAFSHLFLTDAGTAEVDGRTLIGSLLTNPPSDIRRIDITVSATISSREVEFRDSVASFEYPMDVLLRERMTRDLYPREPPEALPLPQGFRQCHVMDFPIAELAALDFAAFEKSPDKGLVAETEDEAVRIMTEMLRGDIGTVVKDGSPAIVRDHPDGGRTLCGFVLSLEQGRGRALIADVAVSPEVRRMGLGQALVHRALRGLTASAVREADLWVTSMNDGARRLYERVGFKTVQREPIFIWQAPAKRSGRIDNEPKGD